MTAGVGRAAGAGRGLGPLPGMLAALGCLLAPPPCRGIAGLEHYESCEQCVKAGLVRSLPPAPCPSPTTCWPIPLRWR